MRKINQEITVRVPVPAAAPLSTGPGGNARHPSGCVWGLAGQSLDSAGPCHGRGTGKNPGRGPAGSGGAGMSWSARYHTRAGHAFPRASPPTLSLDPVYSRALSQPPSPRQYQRLLPALSQPFIRPSPPPGPGPGPHRCCSPDVPTAARRGPCAARPRASGRRESGAPKAPRPKWQRAARKPGDPSFLQPAASSPNSNLPALLGPHSLPTPLPTELLKFATCSPSPRRGSSPSSRDSPPG